MRTILIVMTVLGLFLFPSSAQAVHLEQGCMSPKATMNMLSSQLNMTGWTVMTGEESVEFAKATGYSGAVAEFRTTMNKDNNMIWVGAFIDNCVHAQMAIHKDKLNEMIRNYRNGI